MNDNNFGNCYRKSCPEFEYLTKNNNRNIPVQNVNHKGRVRSLICHFEKQTDKNLNIYNNYLKCDKENNLIMDEIKLDSKIVKTFLQKNDTVKNNAVKTKVKSNKEFIIKSKTVSDKSKIPVISKTTSDCSRKLNVSNNVKNRAVSLYSTSDTKFRANKQNVKSNSSTDLNKITTVNENKGKMNAKPQLLKTKYVENSTLQNTGAIPKINSKKPKPPVPKRVNPIDSANSKYLVPKRRPSYLIATNNHNDSVEEIPCRRNSVRDTVLQLEKVLNVLNPSENISKSYGFSYLNRSTSRTSDSGSILSDEVFEETNQSSNESFDVEKSTQMIEEIKKITNILPKDKITDELEPSKNLNIESNTDDEVITIIFTDENSVEEKLVESALNHSDIKNDFNNTHSNNSSPVHVDTSNQVDYIIVLNKNKHDDESEPAEQVDNEINTIQNILSNVTTSEVLDKNIYNYEDNSNKLMYEEVEYMTIEECQKFFFNKFPPKLTISISDEELQTVGENLYEDIKRKSSNHIYEEINNNKRISQESKILLENIKILPDKQDQPPALLTDLDFISCHEGYTNDDQYTEAINPLMSKDHFISEWIQNMDSFENPNRYSIQSSTSQSSGICEDIENEKYLKIEHSLTVFDEENNPMVKMVSRSTNQLDPLRKDSVDIRIDKFEQEYREHIKEMVENPRINDIIAELNNTEKTYVKALERIVNDYMPEMLKPALPPYLVGKTRTIFGNADMIYEFHLETFMPSLEICTNAEEIAKCFLRHADTFTLYALYSKNKPNSDAILKDYSEYFANKKTELNDKLDVSSYLLTPIQRLGRYILMMERLVKECQRDNLSETILQEAKLMLQAKMKHGNDLIAIDSVIGYNIDLREQGSIIIRDTFTVYPPNKKTPIYGMVFLFEKALLITSIERQNNREVLVCRDIFKNTDLGYTNNTEKVLQFSVWYRKRDQKSYKLVAKNPEMKKIWVGHIKEMLWQQLEYDKKQMEKQLENCGGKLNMLPVPPVTPSPSRKRRERSLRLPSIITKPSSMWYTKDDDP